ncbi:MAG: 7-carboxy-7-deazaguanine synthase QueE [Gammaproteobacteria bacterium]|nr:7-carboxy-7-deazaguanine synthase QueE [Gammaproteobacteria bacterium]
MLKPVQYDAAADTLRITEIFYSLQGESRTVGWPTVFIRLTGCPLRCSYCDTEYAFSGGDEMSMEQILNETASHQPKYVCVTGGEPLAQKASLTLLTRLCDQGYEVSLETSGALDIAGVDERVSVVMDLKTPSSAEMEKNLLANIDHLQVKDQVKFVIADRADYEWSRQLLQDYDLSVRCEVLFSPTHGSIALRELAQWVLDDNLPVRFQVQLHKIIWGEEPRR